MFKKIKIARQIFIVIGLIFFSAKLFSQSQLSQSPCGTGHILGSKTIMTSQDEGSEFEEYSISVGDDNSHEWHTNVPAACDPTEQDIIFEPNDNTCKIGWGPNYNMCVCPIILTCNFTIGGTPCSESISIFPLPYIKTPNCIFPGEPYTVGLFNRCQSSPDPLGCPGGYHYTWTSDAPGFCASGPPCITNNSSYGPIVVPANPAPYVIPATVTMNCNISCENGSPITTVDLDPVSIQVCLRTPQIAGSGCISIGCINDKKCPTIIGDQITLTCNSIPGAGWYDWSITQPLMNPFVSISSGQGTQIITLNAIQAGAADITVRAKTPIQGYPTIVESQESNIIHVNVCCISYTALPNNYNTPNTDQKQAAVTVDASNIISAGQSAMYHAGYDVSLSPGFIAKSGSYFHGYIQECTGNYYRLQNPNNENSETISGTGLAPLQNSLLENKISSINNSAIKEVKILPNPTSGNFTLRTNTSDGYPKKIVIRDVLGQNIKTIDNPKSFQNDFSLENENSGVYMITIYYTNKIVSKKVVKN